MAQWFLDSEDHGFSSRALPCLWFAVAISGERTVHKHWCTRMWFEVAVGHLHVCTLSFSPAANSMGRRKGRVWGRQLSLSCVWGCISIISCNGTFPEQKQKLSHLLLPNSSTTLIMFVWPKSAAIFKHSFFHILWYFECLKLISSCSCARAQSFRKRIQWMFFSFFHVD